MSNRLLVLGFGLIAFAIWVIYLGLRQCQEEGFVGPCPESYYGLTVFITLTLGLLAVAISLPSLRHSGSANASGGKGLG